MRIISQDGTIDVPYDYFSLSMSSGKYEDVEVACIYCHNLSSPNGTKLAKYSTKEKAIKAMELLREVYLYHTSISVKNGNANGAIKFARVFQFPQDDEIEV